MFLPSTKLLVLGNVAVDETYAVGRLPTPGESILAHSRARDLGGKGANQAIVAARAGIEVRLVAAVGQDDAGRWLRQEIASEGLVLSYLVDCPAPSDASVIFLANDADNMIVTTGLAARHLGADDAIRAVHAMAPGDAIVMQGNLDPDVTGRALAAGRQHGLATVFNPSPSHAEFAGLCSLASLVVANRNEARELTGEAEPLRAGQALLARGAASVVVTLAEGGAMLFDDDGAHAVKGAAVTPVDSTGAGDTFIGVLLAAAIRVGTVTTTCLLAAAEAAAITVSRPGARSSFPTRDEIRRIILRHGF